ncbi:MAG: hypothetical protein JWM11_1582 [Planctomycetaceae bacterium]|nr:hypothetical protein [Planctomycetaceae bacterium]
MAGTAVDLEAGTTVGIMADSAVTAVTVDIVPDTVDTATGVIQLDSVDMDTAAGADLVTDTAGGMVDMDSATIAQD